MARVTKQEVQEIYNGTVSEASIAFADQLIDQTLLDCGYSDSQLKEFARLLSAHYSEVFSGNAGVTSIKQGQRSITSGIAYGQGLDSTVYGQQAIVLDTCEGLVNLSKKPAKFRVL